MIASHFAKTARNDERVNLAENSLYARGWVFTHLGNGALLGGLWSWLWPNVAYDLSKQLLLALVLAMGGAVLFGPILNMARGARNIIALGLILFICTFVTASYVSPRPAAPEFAPVPLEILSGVLPGGTQTGIALIMEIVNRGNMASVARDWATLRAAVDGDATYDGHPARISPTLALHIAGGRTITLHEQDVLHYKANTPIQPGASVTGILAYTFDVPISLFLNRRTILSLSFKDVMDRTYTIQTPMRPVGDRTIDYFPGVTIDIQ